NTIEMATPRDLRDRPPHVLVGGVARDGEHFVDRFARPRRVGELVRGQQNHAPAAGVTFADERFAFQVGRDAENRRHLYWFGVNREHHWWHSQRLGRDMGLAVYGHWGPPMIVFPTSGGDEWEFE